MMTLGWTTNDRIAIVKLFTVRYAGSTALNVACIHYDIRTRKDGPSFGELVRDRRVRERARAAGRAPLVRKGWQDATPSCFARRLGVGVQGAQFAGGGPRELYQSIFKLDNSVGDEKSGRMVKLGFPLFFFIS